MHYDRTTVRGRDIKRIVQKVKKCIRLEKIKFNTIFIRGFSGACVGYPLAVALNKNVAFLRKEKSNGGGGTIGGSLKEPALILDDFSATGDTLDAMLQKLDETEHATIILYDSCVHKRHGDPFYPFKKVKIPSYSLKYNRRYT